MADRDPVQPIHQPVLPVFDEEEVWVERAAERFEDAAAEELLAWALERFHPRLAISAAGGVDGMVLVDMAWRINPDVRVFTLDTGRLPPETYELFEKVRERYGIAVEFEYPETDTVSAMVTEHGPNLMYNSVDLRLRCCEVRKVEPLKRKLATLDAWIAGLRREQWRSRKNIAKVELDRDHGGIVKLNPVADWTLDRVWEYVHEHEVPYHPLFDQGYTSIGCAPCTRPVARGESERAGRWWWEQETDKECGIHCSVQLLGSASDSRAGGSERAGPRAGRSSRMSFGYPVMLEVEGRRCVVIGAQAIREGKVEGLLAAGADDVLVVEPSVDERFDGVAAVRVERRAWRPDDLDGAFLAVASSDDAATRAAIAREARARGVLVNVIDDIPQCDWAAPAVVRRGDLVLAIGTGGASPTVARLVREHLQVEFGAEWAEVLRIVGEVRRETLPALPDFAVRAQRWHRALDLDEAAELVHEGRGEELRDTAQIARLLGGVSAS